MQNNSRRTSKGNWDRRDKTTISHVRLQFQTFREKKDPLLKTSHVQSLLFAHSHRLKEPFHSWTKYIWWDKNRMMETVQDILGEKFCMTFKKPSQQLNMSVEVKWLEAFFFLLRVKVRTIEERMDNAIVKYRRKTTWRFDVTTG